MEIREYLPKLNRGSLKMAGVTLITLASLARPVQAQIIYNEIRFIMDPTNPYYLKFETEKANKNALDQFQVVRSGPIETPKVLKDTTCNTLTCTITFNLKTDHSKRFNEEDVCIVARDHTQRLEVGDKIPGYYLDFFSLPNSTADTYGICIAEPFLIPQPNTLQIINGKMYLRFWNQMVLPGAKLTVELKNGDLVEVPLIKNFVSYTSQVYEIPVDHRNVKKLYMGKLLNATIESRNYSSMLESARKAGWQNCKNDFTYANFCNYINNVYLPKVIVDRGRASRRSKKK